MILRSLGGGSSATHESLRLRDRCVKVLNAWIHGWTGSASSACLLETRAGIVPDTCDSPANGYKVAYITDAIPSARREKLLIALRSTTSSDTQGAVVARPLGFNGQKADEVSGASGGLRSRDLPLTRRVLLADSSIYPLSYRGTSLRKQEQSLFKI